MAKNEKPLLPFSYVGNSRFTKDCFSHMRNNVCEMAQFLKHGLVGRLFNRPDGRHIEGGFPHRPIDFGRKTNLKSDQELDTRFHESVGMYQALHEDDNFRLNALNVFALGHILRNAAMFCVKHKFKLQLLIDATISVMLPKFKITRNVLPGPLTEQGTHDRSEFNGLFDNKYRITSDRYWSPVKDYYVFDGSEYTKVTGFTPGTLIPPGEEYYELSDPLFYEVNDESQYKPKNHEFYVKIDPTDQPLDPGDYYVRVDPPEGSTYAPVFKPCTVLDPSVIEEHVFYIHDPSNESDPYVAIGQHPIGQLQGKEICYKGYKPDSDDLQFINAGQAWTEEHPLGVVIVIIPGLTTYPSSTPEKYTLYRKVTREDGDNLASTHPLYVDCTDEDVEKLKDYCNLLLLHYRTILIVTSRKRPFYREIVNGVHFTIEDLMLRINDLIDCGDFRNSDGTVRIEPLQTNNYTIRDMKLKFNELVDAIVDEAYFLRVVKPIAGSFEERMSMRDCVGQFLGDIGFNQMAWEDLIVSVLRPADPAPDPLEPPQQNYPEVVREWDGYCYNDLGFVYNPYQHQFYNDAWDALDFTKYGLPVAPDANVFGTMTRRMGRWVPGFEYNPDAEGYSNCPYMRIDDSTMVPLTECIDLVHIADTWRACDYIGSLYSIDAFCRMFNAVVPDNERNNWSVGLTEPWNYADFETHAEEFGFDSKEDLSDFTSLLDEVKDLEYRLHLLFNAVQLAAYTIVDLGLRVSDYSVIYTCE